MANLTQRLAIALPAALSVPAILSSPGMMFIGETPAIAQTVGISICGSNSLSVSSTSSNVQLTASCPSALLWNITASEVFIATGSASTTSATTSSASLPGNAYMVLNVGNSGLYLAAIAAAGNTSTVRVVQGWSQP